MSRASCLVESDRLRPIVLAIMAREGLSLQAMADRLSMSRAALQSWLGGGYLCGVLQPAVRLATESPCG
jgi:hypothetical protein